MDIISYNKARSVEKQLNQAVAAGDQLAETQQARVGRDTTVYTTLKERLDAEQTQVTGRVTTVEDKLKQQDKVTSTIGHGTSIINSSSDVSSPLKVEFYGQTRTNGFGKKGKGNSLAGWTNTSGYLSTDGTYIYNNTNTTGGHGIFNVGIQPNKYYLIKGIGKTSATLDNAKIRLFQRDSGGNILSSHDLEFKNTGNSDVMKYVKLTGNASVGMAELIFLVNNGNVLYTKDFAIYEISADTYNKIGVSLLDADVEKMFPYVNGVAHIKYPVVQVSGSQLFPSFSNFSGGNGADLEVVSPYKAILKSGTTSGRYRNLYIDIVGGQTISYKVDITGTGIFKVLEYKGVDYNGVAKTGGQNSWTLKNDTNRLLVELHNDGKTGDTTYSNPMLNFGSTVLPFQEKNDSYLYAETILAGNDNKKDISWESGGKWYKTKWFETGVSL